MKTSNINIPNALSAYRIAAFPVILWFILSGQRELFFLFLFINLVTDILDGFIARNFNMETEFGARLDSFADMGTYLLAFAGLVILEHDFVQQQADVFITLIVLYVMPQLICLIRFKRTTSLHLYSSKVTGYLQGVFMLTYYLYGPVEWYFLVMCGISALAYLEATVIMVCIPKLRSNVKGIYFMLREFKRIQ